MHLNAVSQLKVFQLLLRNRSKQLKSNKNADLQHWRICSVKRICDDVIFVNKNICIMYE